MPSPHKRLDAVAPPLVVALAHKMGWLSPEAAADFYKTVASLTVEAIKSAARELGINETVACAVVQKHVLANVDKLNTAVCMRMWCDGNHTS
jgi:hypothetical protein